MLRLLGKSNSADKVSIKAFKNKLKKKVIILKFIIVIIYNWDKIQMFLWFEKIMHDM